MALPRSLPPKLSREALLDNVDVGAARPAWPPVTDSFVPVDSGMHDRAAAVEPAAWYPPEQYAPQQWRGSDGRTSAAEQPSGGALTDMQRPWEETTIGGSADPLAAGRHASSSSYQGAGSPPPQWSDGNGRLTGEGFAAYSPYGSAQQQNSVDWGEVVPLSDWGGESLSDSEGSGWDAPYSGAGARGQLPREPDVSAQDFLADGQRSAASDPASSRDGDGASTSGREGPYDVLPSDIVLLSRPEAVRAAAEQDFCMMRLRSWRCRSTCNAHAPPP